MQAKNVVARLTAIREDRSRLIVEVSTDSTYSKFYKSFTQQGTKRSSKKLVRTSNRNMCIPHLNAHLHQPGLEAVKDFLEKKGGYVSVKVRVVKKRIYKHLITCAPDVLGGMARSKETFSHERHWERGNAIPIQLPKEYVSPLRRRELAKIGARS